jgi:hypothetical protein
MFSSNVIFLLFMIIVKEMNKKEFVDLQLREDI